MSSSSAAGPVGIKGVAFKGTIEFVRAKAGDEGAAKLVATLPDDARAVLSRPILATSFYPFPWLLSLQDGAATLLGGSLGPARHRPSA